MGAVGVRATKKHLEQEGFAPIELERYCASNKIWTTKVKRLRVPDLLCVRTGLRLEVRAKSKLTIRMSDAPNNPARRWDVGLRDKDIVAFVACDVDTDSVQVAGEPILFQVADLRAAINSTKLHSPKSGSEGAERAIEWPSTIPKESGVVLEVTPDKIVTHLDSGRRYSYRIKGRTPYCKVGDRFVGGASVLAGCIPQLAQLSAVRSSMWDPIKDLEAEDAVDRYAAARALPHREKDLGKARDALVQRLAREADDHLALELAASAARLGVEEGWSRIARTAWHHNREDLRMEAVLILAELEGDQAAAELLKLAKAPEFKGKELRQAATWGLGKAGCRNYRALLDLLDDEEDEVVLHAVVAFGPDTPRDVIDDLVGIVQHGNARERAAASEALRLIGSESVVRALAAAARESQGSRPWVLATLGRVAPSVVRSTLCDNDLLAEIEPMLALGDHAENWLASPKAADDLHFLLQQNLI